MAMNIEVRSISMSEKPWWLGFIVLGKGHGFA